MLRKITFLAYFFICANVFAQQYPFVYYTPNDGLVNSRVRRIKQDSNGRIYFMTYGGLSVYDGARFINYRQQDGLANELVNDIVEIAPDSLLVATNTNKLNTLVHGKIGVYRTSDNFCPVINRFFKSDNGNWYAAADEGFFKLTGNQFTRLPFSDLQKNDLGGFLNQFIEWKNFFLIVPWKAQQKQSLILYNRLTQQVLDANHSTPVISLAKDSFGQIWVSTPNGIMMLDTGALEKGKISFIDIPQKYKPVKNVGGVSIFFDSQNNLWLYGNDIIEKISAGDNPEVVAAGRNLKSGNMIDIFEDREGIIWMASDGNGVIKIKVKNMQFINELGTLPLQASTIQQEEDTTWLFNIADNTIYRIFNNSIAGFHLVNKVSRLENIYIIGQKIYLSDDKEIMAIQEKNTRSSYQHPSIITTGLQQGLAFGYGVVDKYGSIIQLLNKNDTAFFLAVIRNDKVVMEQPIESLSDQFAIDRSGKLWLATRGNHLIVFAIHPEQPSAYLQMLKDYSTGLPFTSPRSMAIDTNNNMWLGTRYDGIFKIQINGLQTHSYRQFTIRDGLTDNFIYTLHVDGKNNVWAGTQTGLDKIFLKNHQYIISNISRSDNFFQTISRVVTDNDHTAWALTSEGTLFKVSSVIEKLPATPTVLINLLKVNDKSVNDFVNRFSYNENNFLFSVAAPSFTDEKSIRYSYLLAGSGNNKWSDPSNNTNLNFINSPPGAYTLHVKAEFPDAMYNAAESSFSFLINPPWWQTWWFRIFISVIAALLTAYLISAYVKRRLERQRLVMEKQQAIAKERTRIATDMHDDLGAGLSSIRFSLEKVKRNTFSDVTKADIDKILVSSSELIDKMNEIVWAMNEKNDSLDDLITYIRSYAKEYCEENGIECEIKLPENIPTVFVSGEIRRNIFLTIKECLHNIIKHSNANKTEIEFNVDAWLYTIIRDNGKGYVADNKKTTLGNGLKNMRKRIESIGGNFKIYNNNGVTIEFEVPLAV